MKKRITILGSCSGTEPMPGRHHTSWMLEIGPDLYCFDAGEGCAHTAYLTGLDLLSLRALFISHPHLDHVGGIPHLIWMLGKLAWVKKAPWRHAETFRAFTPNCEQFQNLLAAVPPDENPKRGADVAAPIRDGVIYKDEAITVEARHNTHLGVPADGAWKSFSFKITCPDAVIVYSGDVGSLADLGDWPQEADVFLMETGHHDPEKVIQDLVQKGGHLPQVLLFMHHGRKILADPAGVAQRCEASYPARVFLADDGMSLEWDSAEETEPEEQQ